MPSVEEIKQQMDARYADGPAYSYELAWDIDRHHQLHAAVSRHIGQYLGGLSFMCSWADPPPHLRVLDVGCGLESAFDKKLNRVSLAETGHATVILSDISEAAMATQLGRHGQRRQEWAQDALGWGHKDAHFDFVYEAKAAEELLPGSANDGTIDMIVSVESIEHWSDVEGALANLHRLLKPGGGIIVTTPNRDSLHVRMGRKMGVQVPFCANDHTHEFGYDELTRVMSRAGFDLAKESGVGCAPYWALEIALGGRARPFTESDKEVIGWMNKLGEGAPELAFCQVKTFVKEG